MAVLAVFRGLGRFKVVRMGAIGTKLAGGVVWTETQVSCMFLLGFSLLRSFDVSNWSEWVQLEQNLEEG